MLLDPPTGTNRYISADFFTPSYRIVGKISVPSIGLMGLLNDPNSSFAEIHDARLARLHMPTKLVDHYQMVKVLKSQLFAVCLARREDLGSQAVSRGSFSRTATGTMFSSCAQEATRSVAHRAASRCDEPSADVRALCTRPPACWLGRHRWLASSYPCWR